LLLLVLVLWWWEESRGAQTQPEDALMFGAGVMNEN